MPALTKPDLNPGEIYIGTIINADGTGHHTILLPGDMDDANWKAATTWAKQKGGTLPDRVEQAMLFKHFKGEFKPNWYWSDTQHPGDESYAYVQRFDGGYQDWTHKDDDYRARAVRRLPIQ